MDRARPVDSSTSITTLLNCTGPPATSKRTTRPSVSASWIVGRSGDDGSGGAPLAAATSPAATSSPAPRPSPTAATPRPPVYRGVVLRLRASGGESWVSVRSSSGTEIYQGVLTDGMAREFRDDTKLSVRFGNSDAVRVTQNGKDMGQPQCERQVCTVAICRGWSTRWGGWRPGM